MKIIRVTTSLDFGGIEKVFELHAKYYDKTHELMFVSLCNGGYTQKAIAEYGYSSIALGLKKATIPSFEAIKLLVRLFKEEKPDVVHAAGAEANFHATIAARLTGVKKIICEEIGIPNHSLKARLVFRTVYKFANAVIAISKAVEDYLLSSGEVPRKKLWMIYNPIEDSNGKQEYGTAADKLRFITVARLEPVKNISILVKAFSRIVAKYPDAELFILGNGSLKEELQDLCNALGLSSYVHFHGYISDPTPYLTGSRFFVLPSLYEGFGLACVEAIQCNVLTISTNSGGIPEFITDKKEGFLFDPRNRDELVAKMEQAIQLSDLEYNNITQRAKTKVKSMFSPNAYIHELNQLYIS
ncbi:glycosyltransferase [Pontibacter korlensis]|uniref:glycosyltransferase n=1 Tax=Pontibacter korlensis TaxID=400092 RepID=UPI000697B8D4|nr:glycosyltransferase [Pontibacter korlensis]